MRLEGNTLSRIIIYSILLLLVLLWLFPLVAILSTIIKTPTQFDQLFFWAVPDPLSVPANMIGNFIDAWSQAGLGSNFANSLLYATAGGVGSAFVASLAGFALVHLKVRNSQSWFMGIFSGNLFPFQMFLIPLYIATSRMGLYDTRLGMALVYIGICTPFALLVYRNYALTIPQEVIEAARVDGCSDLEIYWKIFMPLTKAAFIVVFIFQFRWTWNDILFGMVLTQEVRPVMTALSKLSGLRAGVPTPVIAAGAVVASAPTVIVLLGLQSYFVKGLSLQTGK